MRITAIPVVQNLQCDPPMSQEMTAALVAQIKEGVDGFNKAWAGSTSSNEPTPTAAEVIDSMRRVSQQELANPDHVRTMLRDVDRDERKRRQRHFGKMFAKYGFIDGTSYQPS